MPWSFLFLLLVPSTGRVPFCFQGWEGRGLTRFKVEEAHIEEGGEVRPREEDGAEECESLHGGAVVLRGVGEVLLLLCDLEAELRLPDGGDVVELFPSVLARGWLP